MKHAIWIFLATYTAVMVVACGKNGSDATIAPAANGGCPTGSTFSNGSCVGLNGIVQNTGYTGSSFKSDNFKDQTMSVSSGSATTAFLRDGMAICDRGSYNYGSASCSDYVSGYAQVVLQSVNTAGTTARVTIEVLPRSYGSYGYGGYSSYYYASLPSAQQGLTCGISWVLSGMCLMVPTATQMQIARNPLSLDLVISAINNNKGFEGRGYGGYGTISQTALIQLQVPNGKLTDGFFDFKLIYNGQAGGTIMSGRMNHCADASCGTSYPPLLTY